MSIAPIRPEMVSDNFVRGFTLAHFLQMVEMEEKSCSLQVVSKSKKNAFLHFREGILIDAQLDGKNGEEAAIDILAWDDVSIKIENDCRVEDSKVKLSLKFLILEAIRLKDEQEIMKDSAALLERGIQNAEAQNYKQAMTYLKTYLTDNRDSAEGWLWISRCGHSVDWIRKALNKAVRLLPGDVEIAQEIEKLRVACRNGLPEKLRRCPLCWAPIDIKALRCGYCHAHLIIGEHADFTACDDKGREFYEAAIQRYERVLEKKSSANALFFLTLAHFNLQQFDAAMESLHRALLVAPEKLFLKKQLFALQKQALCAESKTADAQGSEFVDPGELISDKRVLVVEDSPTARALVVRFLDAKGFTVIEAQDGFEALAKLNEDRPDLVLLDIILPGMDGYKILSVIRRSPEFRQLPVIMLTSKDGLLDKVKGRLARSTAYLTKPFDPDELLKTIAKYL